MPDLVKPTSSLMTRRRLAWAAVAGLGMAGGGAGGWWWRERQRQAGLEGGTQVSEAVWQAQLPAPGGHVVQLAALKGRPLLINFWATWCPPCVEEMPMLDRFAREQGGKGAQGVQVLAIAADRMEPVQKFLQHNQLTLPVAVGGADVLHLGRLCGNLSGSLPFSILFDAQQNVIQRKLGKLSPADLVIWGEKA